MQMFDEAKRKKIGLKGGAFFPCFGARGFRDV